MKKFSELKIGEKFCRQGKKPGSIINTVFEKITDDTYRKECMTRQARQDVFRYPFLTDIDPDEPVYRM